MSSKYALLSLGRAIAYLLPPIAFLFIVVTDLNLSGRRHYFYDFHSTSPVVSELFPSQRLKGKKDGQQELLQSPVYFTVRYPHRYDTATVRIASDMPGSQIQVGLELQGPPGSWNYELTDVVDGLATFDLSAAQVTSGRLRFIITADDAMKPVFFDSIDVVLVRQPISLGFIANKIMNSDL